MTESRSAGLSLISWPSTLCIVRVGWGRNSSSDTPKRFRTSVYAIERSGPTSVLDLMPTAVTEWQVGQALVSNSAARGSLPVMVGGATAAMPGSVGIVGGLGAAPLPHAAQTTTPARNQGRRGDPQTPGRGGC